MELFLLSNVVGCLLYYIWYTNKKKTILRILGILPEEQSGEIEYEDVKSSTSSTVIQQTKQAAATHSVGVHNIRVDTETFKRVTERPFVLHGLTMYHAADFKSADVRWYDKMNSPLVRKYCMLAQCLTVNLTLFVIMNGAVIIQSEAPVRSETFSLLFTLLAIFVLTMSKYNVGENPRNNRY